MLNNLILNSPSMQDFMQSASTNRLSHAYLILGEDILVREKSIGIIARAILCKDGGCMLCASCKKINDGLHEDIKTYNTDGKLKVKDAESIIEDTYIKGWSGDTKLYFIDNAEQLSPVVQNKLLRIYEEPPKGVIIFLLARSTSGILATILSRAKKLYLPVLSSQSVYDELLRQGIDTKTAETASIFSGGRLDKAIRYANEDEYIAIYDRIFEIMVGCKKSSDIVMYLNDAVFNKDNISITIEFIEAILRDCLEIVSQGDKFLTINKKQQLMEISKGFSTAGIAMAILSLTSAKRMLLSNINATTVAETILFDLLEAKYKWQ